MSHPEGHPPHERGDDGRVWVIPDASSKAQDTDHPRLIDRARFLRGIAALGMGAFTLMPATKAVAQEVANDWINEALGRGEPVLLELPPQEYAADLTRAINLQPASIIRSVQEGSRAFIRIVGDPTTAVESFFRGPMANDATVRDLQIAGFIPDGMDRYAGAALFRTNGVDAQTLLRGFKAANIGVTDWPGHWIVAKQLDSCEYRDLDLQRSVKGGMELRGVIQNTSLINVNLMSGVENKGTYGDDAFAHIKLGAELTPQEIGPSMGNVMDGCTFYRAITPGYRPGGVAGRFWGSNGGTADKPTWLVKNTTFKGGNSRLNVCTLTISTQDGHGPRHLVFDGITVDPMGQTGGIRLNAMGYRKPSQQPQDITINVTRMGQVASGRKPVEIDPLINPSKNRIQIWIEGRRVV
jgi:hypothetical protein